MLKAFDCYFDKHSPLRVFAEDGAAAEAEYVRLYALAPAAEYKFHFAEIDPRLPPPAESPGWRLRRELAGTVGTERKLTEDAVVVQPAEPIVIQPEPTPPPEPIPAPPATPDPVATAVPPPKSAKSK